MLVSSSEVFP